MVFRKNCHQRQLGSKQELGSFILYCGRRPHSKTSKPLHESVRWISQDHAECQRKDKVFPYCSRTSKTSKAMAGLTTDAREHLLLLWQTRTKPSISWRRYIKSYTDFFSPGDNAGSKTELYNLVTKKVVYEKDEERSASTEWNKIARLEEIE